MQFNGERLRVLRRYHDYTQRELADLIGVTASTITTYERNSVEPKEMPLNALGVVLKVQPRFFYDLGGIDEFRDAEAFFRSRVTTTNRLRQKILAHASLFGILMDYLGASIRWPELKLPKITVTTTDDIERAAERCRIEMDVDIEAPIINVTQFAELAGAVVTSLDAKVSSKVDAFSRYGDTSMIVLNPARQSTARTRFDIAHEIAHGVCHRGSSSEQELREKEKQAEYFAGAFLMPREAFSRELWLLGNNPSWNQLVRLKERWGVHLPAIIVRAYQLGLIDAAEYQRRFKYMAKAGWLRADGVEPGESAAEPPQLIALAMSRFQGETGKTSEQIATELNWSNRMLSAIAGISMPPPTETPNVSSFEAFRQKKLASG